ncbi:MAG: hypothetical protein DRQ40_05145, partial [Gammaproteobacteria bacterium]
MPKIDAVIKLKDEYITPITSKLEDEIRAFSGKQVDANTIANKLKTRKGVNQAEISQSGLDNNLQTLKNPKNDLVDADELLNSLRETRRDYYTSKPIVGQSVPIKRDSGQDQFMLEDWREFAHSQHSVFGEEGTDVLFELNQKNVDTLREGTANRQLTPGAREDAETRLEGFQQYLDAPVSGIARGNQASFDAITEGHGLPKQPATKSNIRAVRRKIMGSRDKRMPGVSFELNRLNKEAPFDEKEDWRSLVESIDIHDTDGDYLDINDYPFTPKGMADLESYAMQTFTEEDSVTVYNKIREFRAKSGDPAAILSHDDNFILSQLIENQHARRHPVTVTGIRQTIADVIDSDLAEGAGNAKAVTLEHLENMSAKMENIAAEGTPPVIYNFPAQAYSDVTLPDTVMGTYRVNIYNNPSVNLKGVRYTSTHFDQPNVFETRIDLLGPEQDIRRIQELQSDPQNILSGRKQREIKLWQESAEKLKISTYDVENSGIVFRQGEPADRDPLNVNLQVIRSEVSNKWLKDAAEATGLDYSTVLPGYTVDLKGLMRATQRAIMKTIRPGFDMSFARNTPLDQYMNMLARGEIPQEMDTVTKEMLKEHFDLTSAQIGSLEDVVKSAGDDFDAFAEPLIRAHNEKIDKEILARRRSGPRAVAQMSASGSPRLAKEVAVALPEMNTAVRDVLAKHDYVNGASIKSLEYVPSHVMEAVIGEDLDVITKRIDDFYSNGRKRPASYQNPDSKIFMEDEYRQHTTKEGVQILDEVFGFSSDKESIGQFIADVVEEARDASIGRAAKALDKEFPLKAFPKAKEFQLEIPWQKQGVQEEVTAAIREGQKEVWLNVKAAGTEKLIRGKGPQKQYSAGGEINRQFRAVARKIKAEIVEEDGYLKMKLPAAAAGAAALASFNTYADTNRDDFVAEAMAQGLTEAEADDYWYNEAKESESEYQAK